MKKYISSLIITAAFFSIVLPVFAQEGNATPHNTAMYRQLPSGTPPVMHEKLGITRVDLKTNVGTGTPEVANLQDRAEKELTRRLDSLQKLANKIGDLKHLTSDQKSALTTQVQNEITNMTNLQTKIKADTDPDTLQTDVQSIVQDYRVYALFMPQLQILLSADRMGDITDNLTIVISKLQTRISQVPTGTNVTSVQNALTDMQTKLADAKTQQQNATNLVITLTPQGYPANKTSLQNARAMLQSAKQDIMTMLEDMQVIRDALKQWENSASNQPSVTESLSPSPTL